MENVEKCVVTKDVILSKKKPVIIYKTAYDKIDNKDNKKEEN